MKCNHCGFDNDGGARFCQACGSALPFNQNPVANNMLLLVKDELFMILCIVCSASIGFSLLHGGVPILRILMMIFLWLVFAQGRKGNLALNYLRCISGTIFASYVVQWVACGMLALCGVLVAILSFSLNMDSLWDMFYSELEPYIGNYLGVFTFFANSYLLILAVIFIIIAIVGIFFNVLGTRSIHRFAQSIYQSLEYGQMNLSKPEKAYTWLLVFGIIEAVSAIFSLVGRDLFSFIEGGCVSAAYLIGSILLNKYLKNLR